MLDAKIGAGDISLSIAGTYPETEQNPAGVRTIKQTLFLMILKVPVYGIYRVNFK
ncbi:MAG: hypothetical protein HC905_24730 [Bacteroidales bacterium]|nr:hypothetical protein [Bacteroidales bacterium]